MHRGGVIELDLDCIVNAANERCLGGGGVDGAIHDAAGPLLLRECATFPGCKTGHTRITKGYCLPARFVLHTVGPIGHKPKQLRSCYWNTLELMKRHGLRSVGFCCISTGIFGFPVDAAADVALSTTKEWLETGHNAQAVDRIVFACFRQCEEDAFASRIATYFPDVTGKASLRVLRNRIVYDI